MIGETNKRRAGPATRWRAAGQTVSFPLDADLNGRVIAMTHGLRNSYNREKGESLWVPTLGSKNGCSLIAVKADSALSIPIASIGNTTLSAT